MARIPFEQRYPDQLALLQAAYAEPHRAFHTWDHIADLLCLPGRKTIMAGFLKRERLFLTDTFHATHDAPARANLRRLIERLSV